MTAILVIVALIAGVPALVWLTLKVGSAPVIILAMIAGTISGIRRNK